MRTAFKADTALHSRELLELRHTGSIAAFNKEFQLLAAGAEEHMGAVYVRDVYLDKVRPRELAQLLRVHHEDSLQQLMAAAALLAPSMRREPQRDGDRIKCPKCGRWHHRDAPCPAPGTSSGSAGPGGRPWRDNGANRMERRPPRASEAQVEEGAATDEDAAIEVADTSSQGGCGEGH